MRKLRLAALAAAAAFTPGLAPAQTVPDPDLQPGFEVPLAVAAAAPAQAGHSWRERRGGHSAPAEVRGMRHADPTPAGVPHRRRFAHIPRIQRGGIVPGFWFGPQFVVHNWGLHGFPAPFAGGRWIRYYDDALLIDRYGRVHDGRYGWDWDRRGDRWGYDRSGIPVYVGRGDYEPEERDYEWAERWERDGRGRDHVYRHDGPLRPDCSNPCTRTYHGPPPPMPGYGGYGCGCGPVTVTETIVHTAPVVEQVTTYEYVEEEVVRSAPRRQVRRTVRRAPPPPRPGERG